jgi:hypothetical protein
MKLLSAPAGQGVIWARQGLMLFIKQPIAFTGIFTAFLLLMLLLALIPVLGSVLVLTLPPLMTLVFMLASQLSHRGERLSPAVITQALHKVPTHRVALFKLCAIYALATLAIMALTDWADGGSFDALMKDLPTLQKNPTQLNARLDNPQLGSGLLLLAGLMGLLSVLFWHAPALVYWGGQGCAQALFSSSVACWRNKGAFLIYSLSWVALTVTLVLACSLVLAMLGQARWFPVVGTLLSLILSTAFYASLYFSFTDCIQIDPDPTAAVSQAQDSPVA